METSIADCTFENQEDADFALYCSVAWLLTNFASIGEIIGQLTNSHNRFLMAIKNASKHVIVKEVVSHSGKLQVTGLNFRNS